MRKTVTEYACFSLEGTHHPNEDRWVALKDWDYECDEETYQHGGREKIMPLQEESSKASKDGSDGDDSDSASSGDEKSNDKELPAKAPAILRPSYFGMYDGHGGSMAVEYIIATLHKNIVNPSTRSLFYLTEEAEVDVEGIRKAILEGFSKTEEDVIKYTTERRDLSGSCAVVVIIVKSLMFVANVGDSRAIIGRRKTGQSSPFVERRGSFVEKLYTMYKAVGLTEDQKATTPSEKKRMEKQGGWVYERRVWGSLAVARSFGDRSLKGYGDSPSIVIDGVKTPKKKKRRPKTLTGEPRKSPSGSPITPRGRRDTTKNGKEENAEANEKKKRTKNEQEKENGEENNHIDEETDTSAEEKEKKEGTNKKKKRKQESSEEEKEDFEEKEEANENATNGGMYHSDDSTPTRNAKKKKPALLRRRKSEKSIRKTDQVEITISSASAEDSSTEGDGAEEDKENQEREKETKEKKKGKRKEKEVATTTTEDGEEKEKEKDAKEEEGAKNGNNNNKLSKSPAGKTKNNEKEKDKEPVVLTKEQQRLIKQEQKWLEKRQKVIEKRSKKIRLIVEEKGPSKPGVVIAEPVIRVHQFHPKDDFVLLATDGLWDVVDNGQAVRWVGKRLSRQKSYAAYGLGNCKLVDICKSVCTKARNRRSYDDITTLVFFLEDANVVATPSVSTLTVPTNEELEE